MAYTASVGWDLMLASGSGGDHRLAEQSREIQIVRSSNSSFGSACTGRMGWFGWPWFGVMAVTKAVLATSGQAVTRAGGWEAGG